MEVVGLMSVPLPPQKCGDDGFIGFPVPHWYGGGRFDWVLPLSLSFPNSVEMMGSLGALSPHWYGGNWLDWALSISLSVSLP